MLPVNLSCFLCLGPVLPKSVNWKNIHWGNPCWSFFFVLWCKFWFQPDKTAALAFKTSAHHISLAFLLQLPPGLVKRYAIRQLCKVITQWMINEKSGLLVHLESSSSVLLRDQIVSTFYSNVGLIEKKLYFSDNGGFCVYLPFWGSL